MTGTLRFVGRRLPALRSHRWNHAPQAPAGGAASAPPRQADVDSFRKTIEPIFMRDRGGTMPGYAACVMCHTWQTSLRFDLETPATDAGWTPEQSRKNFEMITQLVNTRTPENSRLLLKPLEPTAGGLGHTGGTYWTSRDDPEYQTVLKWIRSLPADRYVPAPAAGAWTSSSSARACRTCSRLRAKGTSGAATATAAGRWASRRVPGEGRTTWNEEEARAAFRVIARLIVAGQSRAEPLPAEAAASRRRRLVRAQRGPALAEPRRPRVADAGRLGSRRAQGQQL